MKRRSLLTKVLAGSFFTPTVSTCSAFASNSKTQSKELLSPYDAVKAVYDNFVSPQPETELIFDDSIGVEQEGGYHKVYCKLISFANKDHKHHDVWIIFNDTHHSSLGIEIKTRELIISEQFSRDFYLLSSKGEYDVPERFRFLWRQSGKCVVCAKELYFEKKIQRSLETCPIFGTYSQPCDNEALRTLTCFLNLIMG